MGTGPFSTFSRLFPGGSASTACGGMPSSSRRRTDSGSVSAAATGSPPALPVPAAGNRCDRTPVNSAPSSVKSAVPEIPFQGSCPSGPLSVGGAVVKIRSRYPDFMLEPSWTPPFTFLLSRRRRPRTKADLGRCAYAGNPIPMNGTLPALSGSRPRVTGEAGCPVSLPPSRTVQTGLPCGARGNGPQSGRGRGRCGGPIRTPCGFLVRRLSLLLGTCRTAASHDQPAESRSETSSPLSTGLPSLVSAREAALLRLWRATPRPRRQPQTTAPRTDARPPPACVSSPCEHDDRRHRRGRRRTATEQNQPRRTPVDCVRAAHAPEDCACSSRPERAAPVSRCHR